MTPRWILWGEIIVVLAVLVAIGMARFARITPAEALEIQLEAGLLQLYEMELDHFEQHGVYFAPDDPTWRVYLPWMETYSFASRSDPENGFSVVVHADLDGDGEPGTWWVDEEAPEVVRATED